MKTILIIIITLVFSINTTKAQLQGQAKIDSLLKELPKMKEDTNAVNLLADLSFSLYSINPDKGIEYGLQGVELAKEINWKKGEASNFRSVGINYAAGKSQYPNALEYLHKALKIFEELGNKNGIANVLGNIGNIYLYQSDYPKALEYYQKALKMDEEIGDKSGIARHLGNIGYIYRYQSDYPKALEYLHKALKIDEELGDKSVIAGSFVGIGELYTNQTDYFKALEYLQKALKMFEELGYKSGIATVLGNIGNIYGYQSDYPKALEYYHKALQIFEELGNKNGIANVLGNIGNIYDFQSDYPKALEYLHKALKIYEELGDKHGIALNLGNIGELYLTQSRDSIIENSDNKIELLLNKETNLNKSIEYMLLAIELFEEIGELDYQSQFYKFLSEAYQLKGDYKKAYDYYKQYKTLKDSVFSSENQTTIAKLEAKRENEVKQKEIEILKKDKENQKLQRYAMFGGIAGLGIIIGLILIQRRKSEKLLLNVLPAKIAKRLKAKEHPIADHFDGASIMFVDIVGFTSLSSDADPKRIVSVLNDIFTIFDKLADKHGLEKIKTIGDAYMAVAGIPEIQADHSNRTAQMALDIKKEMKDFKTSDGTEIKFRIGIDCGAVVAGVIGEKKFIYDLWSDAVNTASRMESTGESGQIQITDNFKTELEKFEGNWNFTLRGEFEIKGKGLMKTYYLGN